MDQNPLGGAFLCINRFIYFAPFISFISRRYITERCFESYPGVLLTPEDFAAGHAAEADNGGKAEFYTYRLNLSLEAGKVYGIEGNSATYAQKLWVDGVLLSSVGVPGDSIESMVPQTSFFAVYFEAKPGGTDIIIQRSGFVHKNGGRLFPLYLAEQAQISALTTRIWVRGAAISGFILMTALVFFGIFLFSRERRHFLWFSLACLAVTARTLFTEHRLITTLLPALNWYVALRAEYLSTIGFQLFLFLYVIRMLGGRVRRPINICGIVCLGFFLPVILFTPSTVYTAFLPYMQLTALIYSVALLISGARDMARDPKIRLPENVLLLIGLAGYTALLMLEILIGNIAAVYRDLNLAQAGMMVFALVNALALAINFTRTEAALRIARRSEREMEEGNRMLKRLSVLKSNFLGNITHEMRTPLMVMSGYAQLAQWQLEAGTAGEGTRENLKSISDEAHRLSALIDQLLSLSIVKEGKLGIAAIQVQDVIDCASRHSAPILTKNKNHLELFVEEGCPPVSANPDMLMQMLLNLILNANRRAKESAISLSVKRDGNMASFCVADCGAGIAPERLGDVFVRGKNESAGMGIGLIICKEVVEAHRGKIYVESALGEGTRVIFTLPLNREG